MVSMGADHKPVLGRASEAVPGATGELLQKGRVGWTRSRTTIMGTWVLYLGHKGYICNRLSWTPGQGLGWTREGKGCFCLGGQMGEDEPKKWPSLKWSLETCCSTVQYYWFEENPPYARILTSFSIRYAAEEWCYKSGVVFSGNINHLCK